MAMVTMRAVNKSATATKALAYQIVVNLGVNLFGWPGDLRARNAAINVAARVSRRGIVLKLVEMKMGAVCHALAG